MKQYNYLTQLTASSKDHLQKSCRWQRLIAHSLLALFATTTLANANTLTDISYSTLPGDQVQIQLTLSDGAFEPGSFTVDNPARIALDLPNTSSSIKQKKQQIGVGIARYITAVEAGDRTRVVINLTRLVPYQTLVDGNHIFLTLNTDSSALAAPVNATKDAKGNSNQVLDSSENISNVDFRRGAKGEGRIIITLNNPNIPIDMQKRGDRVVLSIPQGKLPADIERRMDVLDFATPVDTVDAFNSGGGVKIVIQAHGKFDHIAYQTDNNFIVDVKPIIINEEKKLRKKFEYTGERLSLNFQNIDVRAVLQLIADFTGLNLVTSDTVTGNLTLRLKNVPWDQALDIILKTKGLDKRKSGNVMLIAPAEEIAAREKLELEANKQIEELAPLENASIQINYAKALSFKELFESDKDKQAWLSSRGSVALDPRTNILLVRDTAKHIEAIEALVEELDIAVRQVLIEARIVLAQDDFSKELGVRFGISSETTQGLRQGFTSGTLNATTQIINGEDIELNDRLNVDLPTTNLSRAGSIGLALARLPLGTLLELELSAAQAEGRSEVISSPKVITSDQHKAVIESGQEIPYEQASSSGATTIAFKKAVLSLEVTPQITPDDRVIMDLAVNKDEADFSRSINGVPPINTQNVQTQVLVNNGETIVLGGVYQISKIESIRRVPFFGDLPLLGVLFRNTFEENKKTELLIFVTPKILKENLTLN
ncbi:Type IV pilus biogenesis protein PilQ [hydrothermal vent metagenome]|uniref:Type IV pilus biogenesis protein PilQ n=1 Tax=hydrothermal vent metagenome TaxID=652676 RepID=A0A3B0ZMX3_9ZZZZ